MLLLRGRVCTMCNTNIPRAIMNKTSEINKICIRHMSFYKCMPSHNIIIICVRVLIFTKRILSMLRNAINLNNL